MEVLVEEFVATTVSKCLALLCSVTQPSDEQPMQTCEAIHKRFQRAPKANKASPTAQLCNSTTQIVFKPLLYCNSSEL